MMFLLLCGATKDRPTTASLLALNASLEKAPAFQELPVLVRVRPEGIMTATPVRVAHVGDVPPMGAAQCGSNNEARICRQQTSMCEEGRNEQGQSCTGAEAERHALCHNKINQFILNPLTAGK